MRYRTTQPIPSATAYHAAHAKSPSRPTSGTSPRQSNTGLHACDLVLLEANHDVDMLSAGRYPYELKQRIKSRRGHLSNDDAADAAVRLAAAGVSSILLGHLSRENNLEQLAFRSVTDALIAGGIRPGHDVSLGLAFRDRVTVRVQHPLTRNLRNIMPNINIICIGKLKERCWKDAQSEYVKRLGAFCRLNIIEKKEAPLPKNPSPAQIDAARDAESQSILASSSGALIVLSPDGKKMDSEDFASLVGRLELSGDITFAVGGSYGHSIALKKAVHTVLSFSDMTMPHQLFRIVLLEQLYRAHMILGGRTYHK